MTYIAEKINKHALIDKATKLISLGMWSELIKFWKNANVLEAETNVTSQSVLKIPMHVLYNLITKQHNSVIKIDEIISAAAKAFFISTELLSLYETDVSLIATNVAIHEKNNMVYFSKNIDVIIGTIPKQEKEKSTSISANIFLLGYI